MKNLKINTSSAAYEVTIGSNSVEKISEYTDNYDKILLFSNNKVGDLYKNKLLSLLPKNKTFYFQINDGEQYKNINSAMDIYSFLIDKNFSRNSLIICLGGGVICDLGGFVASTFMRGIDFLQIPTSLLAQVDASIGGKVAINHPLGKNLIGAFKQPIGVLIDTNFLHTLSKKEFQSGMGEIIKHSILIKDKSYFDFLFTNSKDIKNLNSNFINEVIYKSCLIKKSFVENDEFEKGDRALLNLGHTYGHALENLYNYQHISHGNAISKGIIFELYLSKELNFVSQDKIDSIETLFKKFDIDSTPIFIENSILLNLIKNDKKNINNNINFILPHDSFCVNTSVDSDLILKVNSNFKNNFLKAVIDIGTNSCRLFIAQVNKENNDLKIITPLYKDLGISKLGKNLNNSGILSQKSIDKTFSILKRFKTKAENMGVNEIIAFATSATREASNGGLFVESIKAQFNIDTVVIPGEIEAKLSFNSNSVLYSGEILTLDIGGGSTEITIGTSNEISYIKSFPIGVVKLTEMFFKEDNYSLEAINSASCYLKGFFKEISKFKDQNFSIIGVAGSVTTNVSVLKSMKKFEEDKIDNFNLTYTNLKDNLNLFLSLPLKERENIIGLEANRADVIISGNIILLTILDLLKKNSLIVSTKDNLEGAMVLNI
ncbi:3-dehydroquinate synthase [uncultured Cetobacterium sp.]|uniref:3-dehydroquinate synthase n=1 Tax=uncultured Cetobacterium sp. TaxID=527638 RepID=UPI00260414B5|nr:3-dehydroquinate synthase [uncultured Cetobacterium sp.]